MAWFNFLKTQGYFDPAKNPEPVEAKNGFQVPYWESLAYLEKLSLQIKEGKDLEHVDELIAVIKNISDHPKDNYRTWYVLLKVLGNLPNDKIPVEIFNYIPLWLSGKFDTMLQSSELCEKLLPKFLPENPTSEDIGKAEVILKYLFEIQKKDKASSQPRKFERSYSTKVDLHYLTDSLLKKNLVEKLVKYCSDNIFFQLADNLKLLLLDYPDGIGVRFKNEEQFLLLDAFIEGEDLKIQTCFQTENEIPKITILKQYESLTDEKVEKEIITAVNESGLGYFENEDNRFSIKKILYNLYNDHTSISISSISNLGGQYRDERSLIEAFTWIYRDLLDAKAKVDIEASISLIEKIQFDRKYRLPLFKRVLLYVIGENWSVLKPVFWKLLDEFDLFSNTTYQKELLILLNKNQSELTTEEVNAIEKIISKGPEVDRETDENYPEYWKFRWYAALNGTEKFKALYNELSKKYNRTYQEFEKEGEIQMHKGSISPIKKDELLEMDNEAIAHYIRSFNPEDNWLKPNVSGLSEVFREAVEENPQKFVEEIHLYNEIPYVYAYNLLMSLEKVWRQKKEFDWEKVLAFCKNYITNPKYYSSYFALKNDDNRATYNWATEAIAYLLGNGMQNDENAFSLKLMPEAKEILLMLGKNLKADGGKIISNDYATHSFNSTGGKVLRALLDYALRKARNETDNKGNVKWEPDVKQIFEDSFRKEIFDFYIIEGLYLPQFSYLDEDWIAEKIKSLHSASKEQCYAFMGGLVFAEPPRTKKMYQLIRPYYEKVILNPDEESNSLYDKGLVRHLVAFYFWQFEDLGEDSLIYKLMNTGDLSATRELVHFVSIQQAYYNSLHDNEKKKFEGIIFQLWRFIENKYKGIKGEEEEKLLAGLPNLLTYAHKLDTQTTELILSSAPHINNHIGIEELLENLDRLKNKGDHTETANFISQIIKSLDLRNYYLGEEEKALITRIAVFLFENGQKDQAGAICNRLSQSGHDFLNEVFLKYTRSI